MTPKQKQPILGFPSKQAFEAWLEAEHASCEGLWLKIAKKGVEGVSYAEALEVALCFGWIDGQKDKLDNEHWLQRFTPRKARSKWSQINCGKVTGLIAQGRVRAAGLQEVERAKADGRWAAAYPSPRNAPVPDDLHRELEKNKRAGEFFAKLDSANRFAILYRIHDAKKPETRARRIKKYVEMLKAHQTIHPVGPR